MTLEKVKEILKNLKKGANYRLEWASDVKTLKNAPNGLQITKYSKGVARFGIDYTHTKPYKTKNTEGLKNDGSLPYGDWYVYPYLIEHNGEYYLRVYVASFKNSKTKTTYFKNDSFVGNVELSKEQLEQMVNDKHISSTVLKHNTLEGGCFNINIKKIISINGIK